MPEKYGYFRVNKVRAIRGNIQYALIFAKDRVIGAKIGGQFADMSSIGAISGLVAGGIPGSVVGMVAGDKLGKSKAQKQNEKGSSLSELSTEEILKMDKNNFEIPYTDIIKMEMKKSFIGINGPRAGVLKIEWKKKESFNIAPNQDFEKCKSIPQIHLQGKLVTR